MKKKDFACPEHRISTWDLSEEEITNLVGSASMLSQAIDNQLPKGIEIEITIIL